MKFLGIDVGTSGTRAIVIDERGRVMASATSEHAPFDSSQIGFAEQSPQDWWRASVQAVRAVLSKEAVRADEIKSIGLSGQMHGAVLLDSSDAVLRPAIIWCDQRTEAECRSLTEKIGANRLIELTCNPALTGFTLPKLLWVREHEPDVWKRVQTILLPKDYVRLSLTGERATDVADASGTLLFNVARRTWSQEMLAAMEIDATLLPRVFESPAVTGVISIDASNATGLCVGTPVVAGAGDQAAGAIGLGIVMPGAVSATIGTSGVVFAVSDRPMLDARGRVHTFCHAVPNRWHVMGVTQAAGLSLRWFRDEFGAGVEDNRDAYERLTAEAATVPDGANGALWLPYLMGERTPHLDPNACAALIGLTANHTRAHIVRAILEGVAFSLRETFEIFKEINVSVEKIRLGGGGARSALWRQIQANVYGRAVETVETEEGAAYGAALLAGVGIGAWSSVEAACDETVHTVSKIEPEPSAVALMDKQYQIYRALYPALRKVLEADC